MSRVIGDSKDVIRVRFIQCDWSNSILDCYWIQWSHYSRRACFYTRVAISPIFIPLVRVRPVIHYILLSMFLNLHAISIISYISTQNIQHHRPIQFPQSPFNPNPTEYTYLPPTKSIQSTSTTTAFSYLPEHQSRPEQGYCHKIIPPDANHPSTWHNKPQRQKQGPKKET